MRGATGDGEGSIKINQFQSTHPLRGATPMTVQMSKNSSIFQSTHPLRGATRAHRGGDWGLKNFNPRTPCGVRRINLHGQNKLRCISIHAPLAGCDKSGKNPAHNRSNFNPRTPCGVRLPFYPSFGLSLHISIHAPLAGCDQQEVRIRKRNRTFQSTHPLRGATANHQLRVVFHAFQSTHPLRGATSFLRPSSLRR